MGNAPSTGQPDVKKHVTSSILLWVRTDQSRHTGMDYWKGPHSGIIAATPGQTEYRQIHLAEHNPGLWPATAGVEIAIPADPTMGPATPSSAATRLRSFPAS